MDRTKVSIKSLGLYGYVKEGLISRQNLKAGTILGVLSPKLVKKFREHKIKKAELILNG